MLQPISDNISKIEAHLGIKPSFRGSSNSYYNILSRLDTIMYASTPTQKPVLIMTFGPTGVGKSVMARAAASLEKIEYSECVSTLVDDLVTNDSVYKQQVNDIIGTYGLRKDSSILLSPPKHLFEQFGKAYHDSRFEMGCRDMNPDDEKWNCDRQNDFILSRAIEDGKNIIFETTGAGTRGGKFFKNEYQWLYDRVKDKYRIVAVFATVRFCELVRRNKDRAVEDLEKYIQNENGPAPRLPNVLDDAHNDVYRKLNALISEVMMDMTTSCFVSSCVKSTLGFKWQGIGSERPDNGEELTNVGLSKALTQKIEFTEDEWQGFRIHGLLTKHVVRAGNEYFKPVAITGCSCPVDRILIYNNNGSSLQLQVKYDKGMPFDVEKDVLQNIMGILNKMKKTVCGTGS
jgi:hypothetical protein